MIANANIERILSGTTTRRTHVLRYRADPAKFKTLANLLNKFICTLELDGSLIDADKIRITVSRGRQRNAKKGTPK